MDEVIRALNYVLDCSTQRLRLYIESGNNKYMEESKIYLDVANIYMNEICSKEDNNVLSH